MKQKQGLFHCRIKVSSEFGNLSHRNVEDLNIHRVSPTVKKEIQEILHCGRRRM